MPGAQKDAIDFSQLHTACTKTFSARSTELNYNKIIELLNKFKTDAIQNQQWQNYSKKYSYTKDIEFSDVLDEIINLLYAINSSDDH